MFQIQGLMGQCRNCISKVGLIPSDFYPESRTYNGACTFYADHGMYMIFTRRPGLQLNLVLIDLAKLEVS